MDGVLEDIRLGLEANTKNLNQRRVAMVRYIGELYNYRLVESNDIFKVSLYKHLFVYTIKGVFLSSNRCGYSIAAGATEHFVVKHRFRK